MVPAVQLTALSGQSFWRMSYTVELQAALSLADQLVIVARNGGVPITAPYPREVFEPV